MAEEGYNPAPDFEEDIKDPLVDISLTDSTELWLIQWPINKFAAADFNGKELSLKLRRDGQLGSFESSSGKTYNIVSHAAQEPDAIVFTTSAAKSKVVGKLSRRVSLARYPEPSEYEKPSSNRTNLSNLISGGSRRRSMSLRDTLTSTHTAGQRSGESSQKSKKKRHKGMMPPSEGSESHITDASLGSHPSSVEKSKGKKKKKIMVEE